MPNASSSWTARFLRVGPLLMVLGAALVLAGLVQTTSSTSGGCDQGCPPGTVLISKYNYTGSSYVFEKPAGNQNVVTLSNASSTGATWHSTRPVTAFIVKGGTTSVLVTLASPQYDGSFSNAVLPKDAHNKRPAISNVQFCGPSTWPTTTSSSTTTSTSTTTTSTSTTTTSTSTSTTSTSTTSTTQPPVTTTTQPPVTTTTTQPTGSTTTTTTPVIPGSTTTTKPVVASTSVYNGTGGSTLPFTGGWSTPLIVVGITLVATGLVLTLSDRRRRQRTQA